MSGDDSFSAAMRELEDATEAYNRALGQEDVARGQATEARNRLNAAQRALDAEVARMRKGAPWGSDWRQDAT